MTAVRAAIPAGIGLHFARCPVMFASLKPPANGFNPSGIDSSVQLQNLRIRVTITTPIFAAAIKRQALANPAPKVRYLAARFSHLI